MKYAGWRRVVAEHVAQVLGARPTDHLPRSVACMLLGIALAAYEQWLADESQDLLVLLRAGADLAGGGRQPLRSSTR